MEIFIGFIGLLFLTELFATYTIVGLDYHSKIKNLKLIKYKLFFIRSNHENKKMLGHTSFIMQVFNYIYVPIYILIAVVNCFYFEHRLFILLDGLTIIAYGVFSIISSFVLAIITSRPR